MQKTGDSFIPQDSILPAWFDSEAGLSLLSDQKSALVKLIPEQFYRVGLQLGLREHSIIETLNVEQVLYCDSGARPGSERSELVIAVPEALPLPENSVDLALMLHTLDYCAHPHDVLREITQILSPEGVLLISGFHPYSLWGVERKLAPREAPFNARFISRAVVQDRLELLGFQSVTGCMLNYQLPKLNRHWRQRLGWMNKVGDRWWPTLGAVYMLAFRKKIYGGLGVRRTVRQGKRWIPELNPAQARVAQRASVKNRQSPS